MTFTIYLFERYDFHKQKVASLFLICTVHTNLSEVLRFQIMLISSEVVTSCGFSHSPARPAIGLCVVIPMTNLATSVQHCKTYATILVLTTVECLQKAGSFPLQRRKKARIAAGIVTAKTPTSQLNDYYLAASSRV